MTMSGKCQDGDGDSLDGVASSMRMVGDTVLEEGSGSVQTIYRQAAAVHIAEGTDRDSGENDSFCGGRCWIDCAASLLAAPELEGEDLFRGVTSDRRWWCLLRLPHTYSLSNEHAGLNAVLREYG
jgi:hypothetical protein